MTEVVDEIEMNKNLADVINEELDSNEVSEDQILPIVGSVIRDKYGYSYDSYNIIEPMTEFQKIADETVKWTALDIVCVYYNPGRKSISHQPEKSSTTGSASGSCTTTSSW